MQQLPMAFINIALGGRNPALDQLGKSLSNDDFGQILGSVRDGEDWLQQDLLDHLSPEQLAELQEQLAGGTSLPEAARILLQQQRQAAGLPPIPIEQSANAADPAADRGARPGGLPWPLSQQLPGRLPTGPETSTTNPQEMGSPDAESALLSELMESGETAPLGSGQNASIAMVKPAIAQIAIPTDGIDSTTLAERASTNTTGSTPLDMPASLAATMPTGSAGSMGSTVGTWPAATPVSTEWTTVAGTEQAATQGQAASIQSSPLPVGRPGVDGPVVAVEQKAVTATAGSPLEISARAGTEAESVLAAQTPLASTLRALLRESPQAQAGAPSRESLPTAVPRTVAGPAGPTTNSAPVSSLDPLSADATEAVTGLVLSRDGHFAPGSSSVSQTSAPVPGTDRFAELMGETVAVSPAGSRLAAVATGEGLAVQGLAAATASESGVTAAARPATALMPELALPQRLSSEGWSQALGERLVVMAGRGQQVAEIKLNPAHLGPLEVKVSLHQDQASVSFLAQHAPVREALEQAIPRLREMFNQQDLQLVNVDVGQRRDAPTGGGEGSPRGQGGNMAGDGSNLDAGPVVEVPISSQAVDSDRRLDLYA